MGISVPIPNMPIPYSVLKSSLLLYLFYIELKKLCILGHLTFPTALLKLLFSICVICICNSTYLKSSRSKILHTRSDLSSKLLSKSVVQ